VSVKKSLDYSVQFGTVPLYAELPNEKRVRIKNKVALYRKDTNKILSLVSPSYHVRTHKECFEEARRSLARVLDVSSISASSVMLDKDACNFFALFLLDEFIELHDSYFTFAIIFQHSLLSNFGITFNSGLVHSDTSLILPFDSTATKVRKLIRHDSTLVEDMNFVPVAEHAVEFHIKWLNDFCSVDLVRLSETMITTDEVRAFISDEVPFKKHRVALTTEIDTWTEEEHNAIDILLVLLDHYQHSGYPAEALFKHSSLITYAFTRWTLLNLELRR